MPPTPYPEHITANIAYTPTVNLPTTSLQQLFQLRLPIIEDLTTDHVKASTILQLRKYLVLYECTSTLRKPCSKLEFVRYFNRLFECRLRENPASDGIHECIRELVGTALVTEKGLLLGSRVVDVAKFLSGELFKCIPDEDFVGFVECLAGMDAENKGSERVTGVFDVLSGFRKSRCLKLARVCCSTGCAEFDRIGIYE